MKMEDQCQQNMCEVRRRLTPDFHHSTATWRDASVTLLRHATACPVEILSLIRVPAISSSDHGAAVPWR